MSSAVNKSSKKFTPKIQPRGSVRSAAPRRLSVTVDSLARPNLASLRSAALHEPIVDDDDDSQDSHSLPPPNKKPRSGSLRVSFADEIDENVQRSSEHDTETVSSATPSSPEARTKRLTTLGLNSNAMNILHAKEHANVVVGDDNGLPTPPSTQPVSQSTQEPRREGFSSSSLIHSVGLPVHEGFEPVEEDLADDIVVDEAEAGLDANGEKVVYVNPSHIKALLEEGQLKPDGSTVLDAEKVKINTMAFTIKDLCQELPIGAKHEEYEESEMRRKDRKRMRRLFLKKRSDGKIRGSSVNDPGYEEEMAHLEQVNEDESAPQLNTAVESQNMQLQMKNGVLDIDESSREVDRHRNVEDSSLTRERIDFEDKKYAYNSYTFSKKRRPERWDADETDIFFEAIAMLGTDFNTISKLFVSRSRLQIKNKFKLEEKKNPQKVEFHLSRRLPPTRERFEFLSRKNLKPKDQIEKDLEETRKTAQVQAKKAAEEAKRQQAEDNANAQKEERQRSTRSRRTDAYGSVPSMSLADRRSLYRKNEEVVGEVKPE